jgi:N-acetylglutamate synthase-like GNAT family acetyltransferase
VVTALLERAGLPTQDLGGPAAVGFWVAELAGEIVGAIGLEHYGNTGLLRSLVVAPSMRGRGIGAHLVETLEREARAIGITQLVLLTETAKAFFGHLGYVVIERDSAPQSVRESAEFRSLCPATAVCMSTA